MTSLTRRGVAFVANRVNVVVVIPSEARNPCFPCREARPLGRDTKDFSSARCLRAPAPLHGSARNEDNGLPNAESSMVNDDTPVGRLLSRREAVAILGATGAALLTGSTNGVQRAEARLHGLSCVARPEQMEGPY